MSPSACLGAVLKIKVTTPARNGIPVILWAPRPYIHCNTLPRAYTDCTILHRVLSVNTHQASHWSLLIEPLWVISYTWSTGAQPLVIYRWHTLYNWILLVRLTVLLCSCLEVEQSVVFPFLAQLSVSCLPELYFKCTSSVSTCIIPLYVATIKHLGLISS